MWNDAHDNVTHACYYGSRGWTPLPTHLAVIKPSLDVLGAPRQIPPAGSIRLRLLPREEIA